MYFWKIEKLKREIINEPLSQKTFFIYLLMQILIFAIGRLPLNKGQTLLPDGAINLWADYCIWIFSILAEVYCAYRLNRGNSGNNFLEKYIPIRVVTIIRCFVFTWLVFYLILIIPSLQDDSFTETDTYRLIAIYSYLILWRIYIPIRSLLKDRKSVV